jgi:hypothetical protein
MNFVVGQRKVHMGGNAEFSAHLVKQDVAAACRTSDSELWSFDLFDFACKLFFDPATRYVLLGCRETRVGATGAVDLVAGEDKDLERFGHFSADLREGQRRLDVFT